MRPSASTGNSPGLWSVAIVGYGQSATRYHLPLLDVEPRLQIKAVVTTDPGRRARAADDLPGAAVLSSVDELWASADQFDLVVIATPVASHFEIAMAAIDAGLGVVVEKPFASSAVQARQLLDAAAAAGTVLTVFQNRRWDPVVLTARELIERGELGPVLRCEFRVERWAPNVGASAVRGDDEGLLFDLGAHLVDHSTWLLGPASSVYAELDHDDDVFVALHHTSGARSHIWCSAHVGLPGPALKLVGDRATYVKPHGGGQPAPFTRGGTRFWELPEPVEEFGRLSIAGGSEHAVPSMRCGWPEFYCGVAAALAGSAAPPVDPVDALRTLEILEACLRSARTKNVVDLLLDKRS